MCTLVLLYLMCVIHRRFCLMSSIRRPAGPTAGVMRVFVKTGSANEMMVRPLEIIVDLIMQGKFS